MALELLLPQNKEAEIGVLGAMIMEKDNIIEILEILSPDDFYEEKHRLIFEAISILFDESKNIDLITLSSRLDELKLLERIGGSSYIAGLISNLPIYGNGKQYAKIVREKGRLRKIIQSSHNIEKRAYEGKVDIVDIAENMSDLEAEINGLADIDKRKAIHSIDLVEKLNTEILEFEDGKVISSSTGFDELDKIVDGFMIPHIWIIGGYTGTGKTFFTLNLMLNLMKGKLKPILFSTENSSTRNILRLIGCITGYHEMKIFKGRYSLEEKEKISEAKELLKTAPLVIYDNVFTTKEIRLKVKKHKIQNGTNLVVIDYIQNLNQNVDDIYAQMSGVAMDLQKMAIELNVGIIAVSQIANEQARKKVDGIISFKGAGEITAVADVAMQLRRSLKDNERHKMLAMVDKVRHGIGGKVLFEFFSPEVMKQGKYIKELKG